jgi:glutathione S-transferase
MVRLAAVEKGAKWKEFVVDYAKQTNFEPWYMNLNPKFDFPTLLYGSLES